MKQLFYCYIHNIHQPIYHRWWWSSNGWRFEACTDGQL